MKQKKLPIGFNSLDEVGKKRIPKPRAWIRSLTCFVRCHVALSKINIVFLGLVGHLAILLLMNAMKLSALFFRLVAQTNVGDLFEIAPWIDTLLPLVFRR